MRNGSFFVVAVALAACSSSTPSPGGDAGAADVQSGADVQTVTDVPMTTDTPMVTDAPMTADVPVMAACGTERPTITGIRGTEGLVIGPDGTIYYSQRSAVGRLTPGGSPENSWVALTGATTVWGLALDPSRQRLYAGSPATRTIYAIDLSADPATATPLLTNAGQPNGLTLAPNGDVIYSDFSGGHVYRVTPEGMRSTITTSRISAPNGVAFGPDGALYVDSYQTGSLLKLTLTDGSESARETVAMGLGAPDGLAFDAMGRIYVGDNQGGRLIRLDADGSNPEVLGMGISAAANVEFGVGALPCTDIYVASGGTLFRYTMGDTAGAAVPWHR